MDASDGSISVRRDIIVTVTDVNDAPVAVDDTPATKEGVAVDIDVLDNDTDEDGHTLTVVTGSVTTPGNGTTVLDASRNNIKYTPNTGFAGFDSFTYTVSVRVVPEVSGSTAVSYAENRTDSVEKYTAGGNPSWRLTGDDSGDFSIDSGGVLSFNSPPDYESPADANTDNDYQITVVATVQSGSSTVSVRWT